MKKPSLTEITGSLILVDANIIMMYAVLTFAERNGNFLEELAAEKSGNKMLISAFTIFELFNSKTNPTASKKLTEGYRKSFEGFQVLSFTESMANNVGYLKELHEKIFGRGEKGPSKPGDPIIGSTVLTIHYTEAIKKPIFVATCDRKDFKEPFWETVYHRFVAPEKDGMPINLYLLKINEELLDKYLKGEL